MCTKLKYWNNIKANSVVSIGHEDLMKIYLSTEMSTIHFLDLKNWATLLYHGYVIMHIREINNPFPKPIPILFVLPFPKFKKTHKVFGDTIGIFNLKFAVIS